MSVNNRYTVLGTIILIVILICACNLPATGEPTDTTEQTPDMNTPLPENENGQIVQDNITIGVPTTAATDAPTTTPTPTYFPSPTNTPIPFEALSISKCASLSIIQDVTIEDGTRVNPGEIFTKVWRISNNGSCAWDANYKLMFHKGDKMSGPDEAIAYFTNPAESIEQKIGGWPDRIYSVNPLDTVDLALILRAPEEPGIYTGFWLLANGSGEIVQPMLWTQIVVGETLEHENVDWTGEWTIKDTYINMPVLVTGVINEAETGQVSGFYYDHKGEVNLIDGWVTEDKNVIEGAYGEPRSKQGGNPFRWRILDNHNQFRGIFWLGQLSANEICGSRHGFDLPDPCMLEE